MKSNSQDNRVGYKETLAGIARAVEERLVRFFDDALESDSENMFNTPFSSAPVMQVRDLTLRPAKRLRAALVWAGAALFDPHALEKSAVIDAAAAMELFQTYLLIHDDFMDQSTTRRGGPSVHVAMSAFSGTRHKGNSLAVLAGDAASAMAQRMLADLDVDAESLKRVEQIFAAVHFDVVHGQILDIMEEVSAMEIAVHKTASYTTVGPLAIGAALSGARDKEVRALAKAAQSLGAAFQFRDDLISTFGDPTVTGKSTDVDLLEGKRTVLIEEAKALSDKLQWKKIEKVLGQKQASPEDVTAARSALVKCGAKAACESHIRELTLEFIFAMERNYFGKAAKQFLVQSAEYLRDRDT